MPVSVQYDSVWTGATLVTLQEGRYSAIPDGAIAVRDGRIVWLGPRQALGPHDAREYQDVGGGIITPGLIDCHTHLVFGGDRSREFEQRLSGVSYSEIAAAGGGIHSTVRATRDADEDHLLAAAEQRLALQMAEGVTCIEIKSGYGLTLDSEMKMLRVARRLAERHPIDIKTSFLAAHALPPEYHGRADDYITLICEEWLPAVAAAGLADAVDGFCGHLAFSPAQITRVFEAATRLGLPLKLHAEQLSSLGGSTLAARFGALSADHLEYATADDARAMAAAGTVAVLLPGACYLLHESQMPPVAHFRQQGVKMALASDSNPDIKARHGYALLFDAHSIASRIPRLFEGTLPSLNIGTNQGASCAPSLEEAVRHCCVAQPFSYVFNGRFKGGYITRAYGQPHAQQHAVQLELAQCNYMEETAPFDYAPTRAAQLQQTLRAMLSGIVAWGEQQG